MYQRMAEAIEHPFFLEPTVIRNAALGNVVLQLLYLGLIEHEWSLQHVVSELGDELRS